MNSGYPRGAGGRARTADLLITNQLLYQLSYASMVPSYPLGTVYLTENCLFT